MISFSLFHLLEQAIITETIVMSIQFFLMYLTEIKHMLAFTLNLKLKSKLFLILASMEMKVELSCNQNALHL